jgi:hypothetical protein
VHPLYLLLFLYEQRHGSWMDWMIPHWRDVRVYETSTEMTQSGWKLERSNALKARLEELKDPHVLLKNIYATSTALCHGDTIMAFAKKFGNVCHEAMELTERSRRELGLPSLGKAKRAKYDQGIALLLGRCDAANDRLSEQRYRLRSQANVVNLLLGTFA